MREEHSAADRSTLKGGKVESIKPLDTGGAEHANATFDVNIRNAEGQAVRGIFKPVDGEIRLRPNIEAGTYFRREVVASDFDRMLGGERVVPNTISRTIDGKTGSVQQFAKGAKNTVRLTDAELELLSVERLAATKSVRKTFLLDVTLANTDRHAGNVMWRTVGKAGKLEAIAIDNGLMLPSRHMSRSFRSPGPMNNEAFGRKAIQLDKESIKQLKRVKPEAMAKMMAANDIEIPAARAAMVRVEALKANPNAIRDTFDGASVTSFGDPIKFHDKVNEFWKLSFKNPSALLTPTQMKKIQKAIQAAY